MPPEDPTKDRTERRDGEVIAMHPAESGMQVGRALLHALHNAGISVLYQDRQMKTVWARIPGSQGVRWFQLWVDADRGDAGEVLGVVTTMVETTEQKRREQTLKALLREVSHRSKNLLAIIQSIATQTGR
ncbi:MAG: sensor histidine kinase, partial [Mesorhizobium sp.]